MGQGAQRGLPPPTTREDNNYTVTGNYWCSQAGKADMKTGVIMRMSSPFLRPSGPPALEDSDVYDTHCPTPHQIPSSWDSVPDGLKA